MGINAEISGFIDHTLLKPTATEAQMAKLCAEAEKYGFATVCVNPYWVPICARLLASSKVKVCSVAGFPLGASPVDFKLREAGWCLEHGADEIDMVMNIGEALSGNWDFVRAEMRSLSELVHSRKGILKVIFENCLLSKDDIAEACRCAMDAGVDFVKTSTGLSTGGATAEDVRLMVATVGGACRVKAAGGIRNAEQALEMIRLGASRIGTSAGVEIVSGGTPSSSY